MGWEPNAGRTPLELKPRLVSRAETQRDTILPIPAPARPSQRQSPWLGSPVESTAPVGRTLALMRLGRLCRSEGVSGDEAWVSFLSLVPPTPHHTAKTLSLVPRGDHSSGQGPPCAPACQQPPSFPSSQFPQLLQSWKPRRWVLPQGWVGAEGEAILSGELASQPMARIFC